MSKPATETNEVPAETAVSPRAGELADAGSETRDPGYGRLAEAAALVAARIRQEPGLLATFGYAFLVLLGGTYRALFFRRLGLNFFDYAEVSDFLVAVFRDPLPLVYGVSGIVLPLLLIPLMRRVPYMRRRMARNSAVRRFEARLGPAGLVAYYGIALSFSFAEFADTAARDRVADIRHGRGEVVTVVPTGAGAFPGAEQGPVRAIFVAQTSEWLVVYQAEQKRMVAIPTQNLASVIREVAAK
jgi:hypothetical protein